MADIVEFRKPGTKPKAKRGRPRKSAWVEWLRLVSAIIIADLFVHALLFLL